MHGIADEINSVEPMQYHKLQPFFMDAGTSSKTEPQEGYFMTTLQFDTHFSIQANAWAELNP
jgi:hypothetical protein